MAYLSGIQTSRTSYKCDILSKFSTQGCRNTTSTITTTANINATTTTTTTTNNNNNKKLLTAVELSLGDSSPYSTTDKS